MRITILFLLFTATMSAQSFKGSFHGWWGDTNWIFHFKKNGKYSRESFGHFGNTKTEGRYKRKGNQVHILTDYKEDYGTVNEYYVIDTDSTLIDLDLGFDYRYTQRPDTLSRNFPDHLSLKRTAMAYVRADRAGNTIDTLRYYGVADGHFFRQAEYNVILFLENSGTIPPKDEISLTDTSDVIAFSTPNERKTAEDWQSFLVYLGNAVTAVSPTLEFIKATGQKLLLAIKSGNEIVSCLFEYGKTNIPEKIAFLDQSGDSITTYTLLSP